MTKVAGPALSQILQSVAGVVAELGGSTSHLASLARERGIPMVLGVLDATTRISYYALSPNAIDRTLSLARDFKKHLGSIVVLERPLADNLINNLTFAFAETGHIEEANTLLPYLNRLVHKQPYPTATLGLIHFRKGHIERAIQLYEEAIHIALKVGDKRRIRQKLNLALGLNLLQSDAARADRFLKKAEDERDGSSELSERARTSRLAVRHAQ